MIDKQRMPRAASQSAATSKTSPRAAATADSLSDLKGVSRGVIDAIAGITHVVEEMHRNIAGLAPPVGAEPPGTVRGISGFVYRSVRGVTRLVGFGLDAILAQLPPLLKATGSMPRRDAVVSALNGVFGDYLEESNNPLAIAMQLRVGGHPLQLVRDSLAATFPDASGRVLVLVHGLCMNDLQWKRAGHDHGAALAESHCCRALYLHYNTGLNISTNGREFAAILEQLTEQWPVPITELVIIGHSMGGLVARSACYYATRSRHRWLSRLKKLISIGTPHHGAPLERAGSWVDLLLGASPYTAPFARLGRVRSAGIQDLRYGHIYDDDGPPGNSGKNGETGNSSGENGKTGNNSGKNAKIVNASPSVPLSVKCFAIAGTTQRKPAKAGGRLFGDGLVAVNSALGRPGKSDKSLAIPESRQFICYGTNHLDLLSSREVGDQLATWIG